MNSANLRRVLPARSGRGDLSDLDEAPGPGEHAQVNIGDAFHFYVVQCESAFEVSPARSRFEIGLAEI